MSRGLAATGMPAGRQAIADSTSAVRRGGTPRRPHIGQAIEGGRAGHARVLRRRQAQRAAHAEADDPHLRRQGGWCALAPRARWGLRKPATRTRCPPTLVAPWSLRNCAACVTSLTAVCQSRLSSSCGGVGRGRGVRGSATATAAAWRAQQGRGARARPPPCPPQSSPCRCLGPARGSPGRRFSGRAT